MLKPMNQSLREKIRMYAKNNLDISDLIAGIDIKSEDLSRTIIKKLVLDGENISDTNFSYAVLGNDTDTISFLNMKMTNCNFEGAKFVGKTWIRNCDARNCNFKNSDVSKVDYRNSNFTGSTFCEATIKINSRGGIGCIFDANILKDLTKYWDVDVEVKPRRKEKV